MLYIIWSCYIDNQYLIVCRICFTYVFPRIKPAARLSASLSAARWAASAPSHLQMDRWKLKWHSKYDRHGDNFIRRVTPVGDVKALIKHRAERKDLTFQRFSTRPECFARGGRDVQEDNHYYGAEGGGMPTSVAFTISADFRRYRINDKIY